jgi:hypothetical protein
MLAPKCFTLSDRNKVTDEVKDAKRRKFLAMGVAGAVVVASVAGYTLLRLPDGSYATTKTTQTAQPESSDPSDPTFDGNGVQLPSLTSDPPHREGSIYFRSDLLQLRLDDGISYYTIPKQLVFSKGGAVLSPTPQTIVIWRAPFACTVTAVKGYQDMGTGSVITAYDGSTDLLSTDITISSAATWQDGGSIAHTAVSSGDSIAIKVVSVSGSPNYLVIQVELTQP